MHAWVLTIFASQSDQNLSNADAYADCAIVTAYQILRFSKQDIVIQYCQSSKYRNFSPQAIENLTKFAKQNPRVTLRPIEFLEVNYRGAHGGKRFAERYKWLNKSLTKYRAFTLTKYDKIALLDADVIIYPSNLDRVFDVPCPAGICSVPEYIPKNGDPIPEKIALESLKFYGIRGVCNVFDRSVNFDDFVRYAATVVEDLNPGASSAKRYIGPDEYCITKYFISQWHAFDPDTITLSWDKAKTNTLFGHFVSDKPWEADWPDLIKWRAVAAGIFKEMDIKPTVSKIITGGRRTQYSALKQIIRGRGSDPVSIANHYMEFKRPETHSKIAYLGAANSSEISSYINRGFLVIAEKIKS